MQNDFFVFLNSNDVKSCLTSFLSCFAPGMILHLSATNNSPSPSKKGISYRAVKSHASDQSTKEGRLEKLWFRQRFQSTTEYSEGNSYVVSMTENYEVFFKS